MSQKNNSVACASAERNKIDIGYFGRLTQSSPVEAARSLTPQLQTLRDEEQIVFLRSALERIFSYLGYELRPDQTEVIIDFAVTTYSGWRTADWRVFYLRCCEGRYGILQAYDRRNAQVLLSWMREYEQERQEAEQTVRLYGGWERVVG